ncbi:Protein O-linked-mannose beta-1,4-N-acetylglucosaminyltransferase 2 [Cladochytrium tenue]|nr:Protein O-linked-mannose beta-1,4-N-acetylglucosaminyltransferase 2 [Cladochytrium tenue]
MRQRHSPAPSATSAVPPSNPTLVPLLNDSVVPIPQSSGLRPLASRVATTPSKLGDGSGSFTASRPASSSFRSTSGSAATSPAHARLASASGSGGWLPPLSRRAVVLAVLLLAAFVLGLFFSGVVYLSLDRNHTRAAIKNAVKDQETETAELWKYKYDALAKELERLKRQLGGDSGIDQAGTPPGEASAASNPKVLGSPEQEQHLRMVGQAEQNSNGDQDDDLFKEYPTKIEQKSHLPPSSVWCYGSNMHNRPKLLESASVANHPYTVFSYDEVPITSSVAKNVALRYETEQHILYKRFHPNNIMHNLHDDVIVLFHHIKEFIGSGDESLRMPFTLDHRIQFIDEYDFSPTIRPFQFLTHKSLRKRDYLMSDPDIITGFRDVTIGSSKISLWYQYGFNVPQGPIKDKQVNGLHIREVAEWFCRRLQIPLGEDEDNIRDLEPLPAALRDAGPDKEAWYPPLDRSIDFVGTDLIILLSRRKNRLVLNEDELLARLGREFGLEVAIVRNEDHSFEEQIRLMRRARVVLAMHGSILIMTMFCRRGTVVVEMYPFAVPADNYTPYKTMAHLPGMDLVYRAWTNTHPEYNFPHDDNDELAGGIAHLPAEEQDAIRNTLTVPQHLCCTNPYWLYRIYQDTHVDADEVTALVRGGLAESRRLLYDLRYHHEPEEAAAVLAPLVWVEDFACLGGESRKPGTLWLEWKAPWTEVPVDLWVVRIENDGSMYSSEVPTVSIGGFEPGSEVYFSVKGISRGLEQAFGAVTYCIV